jgi:hypothetical protein
LSSWEPRWVRRRVSAHGITVTTCYDLTTTLLVCPLCSDISIDELCPEGQEGVIPVSRAALFLTVEDLINHMRTHWHSKRYKRIGVPTAREGDEGGEEGILRRFSNVKSTSGGGRPSS